MSRPRPRPRPKPRPSPNAVVSSTSVTSASSSTPVKSPSAPPDDDDDLFIRHDPRRIAGTYSQKKTRSSSPGYDVNGEGSTSSPETKKRRKEKKSRLPAWTYQARDVTSTQLEPDEDSSGPEFLDDDQLPQTPPRVLPKPKLRAMSFTPPPDIVQSQASTQTPVAVRGSYRYERELTPEDESQGIELLPELAAIQRNVRASSSVPEPTATHVLELHIRWIPHPEQPQYYEINRSWMFEVPQNKPFGEVKRMLTGLPAGVLPILWRNGQKLFDGGTPASLFAGKRLDIQAMTAATHQYYEARHLDPSSAVPNDDADNTVTGTRETSPHAPETAAKINIRLRTGPRDNHPQSVRVSRNSTVEAVIAAFLAKTGRTGMQGVRLQIDGEDLEMDSTIADAELEDGDQVDVAGIEK